MLGLRWLVRGMKRAFYDAEVTGRLVGQARFRIEGHPFWVKLQHTMRNSFILYFCTSTVVYLGTSHPCRCNRETVHGNIKHLHEVGSSFGRGR